MFFYKLNCHISCAMKKIYLKMFYRKPIKIGSHTQWRRNFIILPFKGAKISIGSDCFFNNDCSITAINSIFIGNGTIFGENVRIYDHNHKFKDLDKSIKEQGYCIGEVKIGNHCWIGSNVTILKGTVIGDNCVIGAGCVISGEVPNNTIVKFAKNSLIFEELRK